MEDSQGNGSEGTPISSKIPIVDQYSNFYNVSHKNRGVALIFNHETFDDRNLSPRSGTCKDRDDLKTVLSKLDFDVRDYNNLRFGQIHDILTGVSKEDHSHNDCLLVCVMSHGEEGKIYAKDHTYPPDLLWTLFTGNNCITLAGKPKLFFIQACRGDKTDDGVSVRMQIQTDSISDHMFNIPAMADILVMYSTYQGYFSWRSPDNGSWFIQALCHELAENWNRFELLQILTLVNRRVSMFHQSNVPGNQSMHKKKQVCTIVSMLTRFLILAPLKKKEIDQKQ